MAVIGTPTKVGTVWHVKVQTTRGEKTVSFPAKHLADALVSSYKRDPKQTAEKLKKLYGVELNEMSFDKNYPNRKDQRAPYHKPGAQADASCRPGGDCPYCQSNRTIGDKRRKDSADDQMKEDRDLCPKHMAEQLLRQLLSHLREADNWVKTPTTPTTTFGEIAVGAKFVYAHVAATGLPGRSVMQKTGDRLCKDLANRRPFNVNASTPVKLVESHLAEAKKWQVWVKGTTKVLRQDVVREDTGDVELETKILRNMPRVNPISADKMAEKLSYDMPWQGTDKITQFHLDVSYAMIRLAETGKIRRYSTGGVSGTLYVKSN